MPKRAARTLKKTKPKARTTGRRPPARPARKPKAAADRPATPELARQVLDILETAHPEATCALHYRNPFELLVATILSAQCTDERVNIVTPELFRRYPDAPSLAQAKNEDVEQIIRSTGFFRSKAKSLIGCAKGLVAEHGGQVPRDFDAMVRLPGVGRKTASVVLGHTYGIAEGIAVDTHVLRVSNRIGLAHAEEAHKVEEQLMALIPRERWVRTTDLLIFHGRKICDARRPTCGSCPVFALCRWESRQAFAVTR
jgi:endonuclease-3